MKPIPVVAMFDVRNIIGTCIGIEDSQIQYLTAIYSYHHARSGHHFLSYA